MEAAKISRRRLIVGTVGSLILGGAAGYLAGSVAPRQEPQNPSERNPIKIGFQVHRTGIGADYGYWYERTARAAASLINERGGIDGRPVQLVIEDDGTDPQRGAQVVQKLAAEHNVDFIIGALFSNVVLASGPVAGELKKPYFAVSEGTHVPLGLLNRWCFQPGITDVPGQVTAVSKWIFNNLGRRIVIIYPDYAFGYDHRDWLSRAAENEGAVIVEKIPIPPAETSFSKYFTKIPQNVDVIYHVMVGPSILTFMRELGEYLGERRPALFGFIDSLEGIPLTSPGLEYLEGAYFWEAFPRYIDGYDTPYHRYYRRRVGVNDEGAAVEDPTKVSTYSHMFSTWETLFVIKEAVEQSGYQRPVLEDYKLFITTLESMEWFNEGINHPQGPKKFDGRTHQSFGQQFISQVRNSRLVTIHRTRIEESYYENDNDYTRMSL